MLPLEWRRVCRELRELQKGLALCKTRSVDINVGNHCNQNQTIERAERLRNGDADAFIDSSSWLDMLNKAEKHFNELIESDPL